jgi:Cytochrome c7 and related cytochrome c/Cytochrome c554 and c-prime
MQRMLFMLGLAVWSAALAGAQTQPNQCAECHLAHATAPGRGHVLDWELSAHKRSEIGCERCHGGNPAAFSVFRAHFGVTSPGNAASPLNRRNVSATCGTCHIGPYSAFQKSRHAGLLKAGDSRGPTCVTCHGEAAAQLLSPDAIAGECNQCHGPGKRAPRPERATEVRQWLERVRELRAQLDAVRPMIDAVRDTGRQQQLRDAYRQADAPLAQSVADGHYFVFADSNERLDVARQRTAALYQSIISAPSR